ARHICTQRLRDLDCKRANAARCAVNQNFLSRLNFSFVAQRLQCGNPGDIDRSRVLKTYTGRLQCHRSRRARTNILGESTATSPEHFITWFELSYVLTDCFNCASEIDTETGVFRFAQTDATNRANHVRSSLHKVPVVRINRSRANSYQDLVIS